MGSDPNAARARAVADLYESLLRLVSRFAYAVKLLQAGNLRDLRNRGQDYAATQTPRVPNEGCESSSALDGCEEPMQPDDRELGKEAAGPYRSKSLTR